MAEIAFRTRQETSNFLSFIFPPSFSGEMPLRLSLPDAGEVADALRGSAYAASVESAAREIVEHRFPLLGTTINTGSEIRWRRDYAHGIESGSGYFRRIPYLKFKSVGDHKFVWELNRHQHLVLLAQASLLTGNPEFTREIFTQLESWFQQNRFERGINWASALEVAFRALSWTWVYHLTATEMPVNFRRKLLSALYRHGRYLEKNLSVYFSPNTHLLGEAVALFVLGTLFPKFPGSGEWRRQSSEMVEAQLSSQVRSDGSHFEQSSYYHVYALDFFMLFYLLAERPEKFRPVLTRMAEYLDWLLGPGRRIAFLGDDDGGRVFHPYGERDQFGRATLATCGIVLDREDWIGTTDDLAEQAGWWLGASALRLARQERAAPSGSRVFRESGACFLQSGDLFVQMDCGAFGRAGAGHSHSDTLSLVVSRAGEPVFVDPGTYTYADLEERDWFRSSAAHNTVQIDGLNQAGVDGPFRWELKPYVSLSAWKPNHQGGFIDAHCRYEGFTHRRRVLLKGSRLLVFDEISGPAGEHNCEQIWQLGPAASRVQLSFSAPVSRSASKSSPAYGMKSSGAALIAKASGRFPLEIAMLLETGTNQGITNEEARRILEEQGSEAAVAR